VLGFVCVVAAKLVLGFVCVLDNLVRPLQGSARGLGFVVLEMGKKSRRGGGSSAQITNGDAASHQNSVSKLLEDLRVAKADLRLADAAAKHRTVEAYRLEQWVHGQAAVAAGAPLSSALGADPWLQPRQLSDPRAPDRLLETVGPALDAILSDPHCRAFENGPEHVAAISEAIAQAQSERERSLVMLSALDSLLLIVGQLVLLTGLTGRPELNGRHGVVIGAREGERYAVAVAPFTAIDPRHGSLSVAPSGDMTEERIRLKPQNLRLWRFAHPQVPDRVQQMWGDAHFRRAALLWLLNAGLVQGVGWLEGTLGRAAHHQQQLREEKGRMDEELRLELVVNTPVNSKQNRMLHADAQRGDDRRMTVALLEAGADPMLRNGAESGGATALGFACAGGRDEVVRLICEHDKGAYLQCVHLPDGNGVSPLTVASCHGHTSTVELLLALAVPPHSQRQLNSALGDACRKSREGCAAALLRSDANPNLVVDEPLLLSACQPSEDDAARRTLELLLGAGATPDLPAADGTTAFAYCCQLGRPSLATRLLVAGADPSIPNEKAVSPILLALDAGFQECADLALSACRERADALGKAEVYQQALADVESFRALPRHSYGHNVAARGEGEDAEETTFGAMTIVSDADIPQQDRAPGECCVCAQAFKRYDRVATLGCGHVFHSLCLCRWLDVQPSCPVCRRRPNVE